MAKHSANGRNQLAMVIVNDLVLQDYLVWKIDEVLSFDFVYPVDLVKLVFLQYFFSIRSMLHTIKKMDTDVAYRWFLDFDFTEKVPHFSTF